MKLTQVCPNCGTEFEVEVEYKAPARRGVLQGLELKDMTMDQLKREKTNAKSVLYKAIKRGAGAEVIAKNQQRVDNVLAELALRNEAIAAEKAKEAALKAEAPKTEPDTETEDSVEEEPEIDLKSVEI